MEILEVLKGKRFLKITEVEKAIGCPATTLNIYLKTGYIPPKWKEKLIQWVEKNLK